MVAAAMNMNSSWMIILPSPPPPPPLPSLLQSSHNPSLYFFQPLLLTTKSHSIPFSSPFSLHAPTSPSNSSFLRRSRRRRCPLISCSSTGGGGGGGGGGSRKWSWRPQEEVIGAGERILRLIAGSTTSPIAQYVAKPTTFIHTLDSRTKLVWLLMLIVLPARSHLVVRMGIVLCLACLSVSTLPKNIWMDQLGRVAFLSGILFVMLALSTDGVPPLVQSRAPAPSVVGFPKVPMSLDGYSYVIFKLGPLQLTRKGLSVAAAASCLSFTVFQTASLCLATTKPEEIASAICWFIQPMKLIGVPVSEILLTLLLSLRFVNIVFDEVRNVALGILARGMIWKQLTLMETVDIFVTYIGRIIRNIFNHAEQISQAMMLRGYRGNPLTHRIYLAKTSFGAGDIISMFCLTGLIAVTLLSDRLLI